MSDTTPFLRYRRRLNSYAKAVAGGMSDAEFVDLVEALDAAVAGVEGHGFAVTPVLDGARLVEAAGPGPEVELWIKDDTGNVSGSHKSRHLFGVALHLLIDERLGRSKAEALAIASCGNAAMAAGVIAAALGRELHVFIPTWADRPVVERLGDLGALVTTCPRRRDEAGDPAYLRYREAVDQGLTPFTVQGTDTPTTFDGGRTLGWELADQVPDLDAVYVQVGGGALATSVSLGLPGAHLYPVQTEGCAPLRRAWDRLAPSFDFTAAACHPEHYMWPWESEPTSAATGILDDITYDWLPLLKRTHLTGGEPVVVPESTIIEAHDLARALTDIPVSATGTAGLAGLLHHRSGATPPAARIAVAFTGIDR